MASSRRAPLNLNVINEGDEEQEVESPKRDIIKGGSGVSACKKGEEEG